MLFTEGRFGRLKNIRRVTSLHRTILCNHVCLHWLILALVHCQQLQPLKWFHVGCCLWYDPCLCSNCAVTSLSSFHHLKQTNYMLVKLCVFEECVITLWHGLLRRSVAVCVETRSLGQRFFWIPSLLSGVHKSRNVVPSWADPGSSAHKRVCYNFL